MRVETVKIKYKGGFKIINKDNFDPLLDVIYGEVNNVSTPHNDNDDSKHTSDFNVYANLDIDNIKATKAKTLLHALDIKYTNLSTAKKILKGLKDGN